MASSEDQPVSFAQRANAIFTVWFTGIAILSDGYNGAIIGNLDLIFTALYPESFTTDIYTRVSHAFMIGEIIGMCAFAVIVDRIGRKAGVVATTLILIVGVILSAAASGRDQNGMFWMLIVARGLVGVGAGGEYPVCGASAIEVSNGPLTRKRRGLMMSLTCDLMADLGFVIGGIVPLVVLFAFHQSHFEVVWRLCLAIGAVLPLSIFYFRLKMISNTQYEKHALRSNVPYKLIFKRYWRSILGTSILFFLYDYIAWPFSLFSSVIFSHFNAGESIWKSIAWGTLVNAFYVPGCLIGGYIADTKFGRRKTIAMGFTIQAILGFIIGGAFNPLTNNAFGAFVFLYGLFVAVGEVGPGSCVILVSGESFPTPIRGHFLGLASAFGKAGSAIGSTVFTSILARYSNSSDPNKGSQVAFLIGSAFAVLGAICALLLLPDTPKDLEVEDEAFREYLEANGFDTSQMGMGVARREKTTDEEVGDEKVVMEKGEKQVVVAEQPVVGY
ncbi:metabolite transport protein [Stereum hirsutum FP-91666 SS1]|uniref:metabolite transport protein n=1 Tax=Stereum hirsutum (strain FP-91666) TaxID=721885 RepID=UPI000440F1C3|nr:metabolite transport protein [Stereum hirsutum FP-91666 SS1]EIM87179.1 metabolite transport protein [Stereum hirsutum FP-91666 SS1]